jgi:hypothetical protein
MIRTSIVMLSLSWIVGAASIGLAQTYPSNDQTGNCSTGGCESNGCSEDASRIQKAQAHCDLIKQQADLIAQRNDAWPKPFICYDRQAYHSIFAVMTQRGWQCECTLTSDHFDSETQELNRAGKSKIAGIMTNLPEVARQVHVLQDSTDEIANARLANVRTQIQDNFVALPAPEIAITTNVPHGMSGSLIEDVQKRFIAGLPEPSVPAAKTTTISDQ